MYRFSHCQTSSASSQAEWSGHADPLSSLSYHQAKEIMEHKVTASTYWLCTVNIGITKYDQRTSSCIFFLLRDSREFSLSSSSTLSLKASISLSCFLRAAARSSSWPWSSSLLRLASCSYKHKQLSHIHYTCRHNIIAIHCTHLLGDSHQLALEGLFGLLFILHLLLQVFHLIS